MLQMNKQTMTFHARLCVTLTSSVHVEMSLFVGSLTRKMTEQILNFLHRTENKVLFFVSWNFQKKYNLA